MTQKPGDEGDKPQLKVSMLKDKEQRVATGGGLKQYMTPIAVVMVGVVIVIAILSRPPQPAATTPSILPSNTPAEVGTIHAQETSLAALITPSLDPNVAALQTQNAQLAQSVTEQAATSQALAALPTQAPQVIMATQPPVVIVPPTERVLVVTATNVPSNFSGSTASVASEGGSPGGQWTQRSFKAQAGAVMLGDASAWVTFQGWDGRNPGSVVHGVIEPGWSITIPTPFEGTAWTVTGITYEGVTERALEARDEVVMRDNLRSDPPLVYAGFQPVPAGFTSIFPPGWNAQQGSNQGSTSNRCPTSPAAVAALIGGTDDDWSVLPGTNNTGWKYATGSPAITMVAPTFGRIDYWNNTAGSIRNGQQAQNVTEATFWCGG